ncbi:hypothetical protein ACSS6N_21130 [Peribacillus frigoritolerans]|uniref:hypothetical protein n=1 Tax=Peribacillus frigoritolerans TaxID=450367 RepID=UPI003F872FBD
MKLMIVCDIQFPLTSAYSTKKVKRSEVFMLKGNSYILVFSMAVLLTIVLVSTTPENQLYLRK